jgi:hypothetical protein
MRGIAQVGLILAICVLPSAGRQDSDDLKTLYESHQWFRLRDAVIARRNTPIFYRAAVESAFHYDTKAIQHLEKVMKSKAGSWEAGQATVLLKELRERNAIPGAPPMRVMRRSPARLGQVIDGDYMRIPVTIGGKGARYVLDTGAPISLVSEADAAWLGLTRLKGNVPLTDGWTGRGLRAGGEVGLAERFTIGGTEFRNVLFAIVPDEVLLFRETGWPVGEQGVIGLPVIRELGTIRWDAKGAFETSVPAGWKDLARSNLCFEGMWVIADVEFGKQRLIFGLDTASRDSIFHVRFRKEFPELVRASNTSGTAEIGGLGGPMQQSIIPVIPLRLRIGGFETVLRDSSVLVNESVGSGHHGLLGWGLLNQAHRITIDFEAMRLTLENRQGD